MSYENQKAKRLKIAYIGGGSRGWAWGLMSDLAQAPDIAGTVALYDIDKEAAKANEIIGNSIGKRLDACPFLHLESMGKDGIRSFLWINVENK